MKILVTGASGFLGGHLLEALSGHQVVALSRQANPDPRFVVGDILEMDSLKAAVSECDAVIHAAGWVSHEASAADKLWTVHVQGTENVVAACKHAGVKRLIHISTSGTVAVSASKDHVASETDSPPHTLINDWPYYRSKLFAEGVALKGADDTLDVVCLNPSLLLGPGDSNDSSTAAVRLFLDGQVAMCPRGGLSFADARDVANTAVAALTHGRSGERYLLGASNMTFKLFYERLARITGRDAPRFTAPAAVTKLLNWFPNLGKDGFGGGFDMSRIDLQLSAHTWYLDDAKACRELNWAPRDPLDTLSDTVNDVQWRMATGN